MGKKIGCVSRDFALAHYGIGPKASEQEPDIAHIALIAVLTGPVCERVYGSRRL
jgi:hypothetical protein